MHITWAAYRERERQLRLRYWRRLIAAEGSVAAACRAAGVSRSSMHRTFKRLGLQLEPGAPGRPRTHVPPPAEHQHLIARL